MDDGEDLRVLHAVSLNDCPIDLPRREEVRNVSVSCLIRHEQSLTHEVEARRSQCFKLPDLPAEWFDASVHWLSLAGLTFAALFPLVNPLAALPLFASLTQGGTSQWRKQMAIKASVFVFLILFVTECVGNGLLHFFGLSLGMLQIAGGLIVAHTAWEMSTGAPKISQKDEHRIKRKVFVAMKEATLHAVSSAAQTVSRATHSAGHAVDYVLDHDPGATDDPAATRDSLPADAASDGSSKATGKNEPAEARFPDISFSPMAMPMLAGPGSMGVVIGIVSQHHSDFDGLGIAIGIAAIAVLSLLVLFAATPINSWLGPGGVMVLQRVFGFITLGIAVALVAQGISSLFGIPLVN